MSEPAKVGTRGKSHGKMGDIARKDRRKSYREFDKRRRFLVGLVPPFGWSTPRNNTYLFSFHEGDDDDDVVLFGDYLTGH
ncbi:hypothetical protein NL676_026729 [Syzygium grande]|nr:hypothetical protein NL676_026729 [Syzygium grande]